MVALDDVVLVNPRLPKDTDETQLVTFLKMASVSEQGDLLEQESRVLADTKKGFTYFERGDVLLAKITPCFENGKAALVNKLNTKIGFGSTEFHVLRPVKGKVDNKYLFFLIWNEQFRFMGEHAMKGAAGQQRISSDFLKNLKIPLPPLETQKQIAAVLEKADQLRKDCKKMEQELNSLAQSVFIDMFGDPVTNPKGWDVTYLPLHGTFKNGMNFAKGESGSKLRYLGVGNFKSLSSIDDMNSLGWIELNKYPAKDYLLQCGDLIFVRSNGNKALVGRCISVYPKGESLTFSGFCIRYRIEDNLIESEYLNYLLRTTSMKQALLEGGQGANIQNINQKILSSLAIPLPPKDVQLAFCKAIESYREETSRLSEYSVELDGLFQSLMQKAFKGELSLKSTKKVA
jgi:type I restriction enzyme S subunit